jgi:hypothetical protein
MNCSDARFYRDSDFEYYKYEVEQGKSLWMVASKVDNCIFSGGVGPCLAILVKGADANEELHLGLMHYEADRPKALSKFLKPLSALQDCRVVVIGGHESPIEDPDSGSEEDREEILEAFKEIKQVKPVVVFNPTRSVMDDKDVGDRYLDVKVDIQGRFYARDFTKGPRPGWHLV